jgi:hypothetical protein
MDRAGDQVEGRWNLRMKMCCHLKHNPMPLMRFPGVKDQFHFTAIPNLFQAIVIASSPAKSF